MGPQIDTPIVTPMDEFIAFAQHLARISAERIMSFYRTGFAVEQKSDRSPVTIADMQSEEVIRAAIGKHYPDHGIIGEEFGSENTDAEFTWVIDPIDGTKSFISGTPLFGTLIALARNDEPLLGIINLPALGEMYTGTNTSTDCNGVRVRFRECHSLSEAVLLNTDHEDAEALYGTTALRRLIEKASFYRTWGDCYGYTLLCAGFADIMIDPKLAPWDMYALLPVIRGAGGLATSVRGENPLADGNIIAAHPALQPHVLEIFAENC